MDYRFLGPTGVKVSKLAFGTMTFGGYADEATSEALYRRVRDAGINVFDCADVYNGGYSEELLGRFSEHERDRVVLTSKAYFPTSDDVNARGNSRYHLVRAVEASLRRLQTEYIDLFFLHRWDDMTAADETLRAIDDLVRQGKILYLGVSNFSAWQTMKLLGLSRASGGTPVVCSQPMYNLVKRQAEVEILPMAIAEGIGVMSYSPLGGGLLTGKYGATKRPDTGRLVTDKMYTTRYDGDVYFEAADRFTALAKELGHHPAALAVAWVAAHPGITAPLIGARNLEQLEAVLPAASIDLDAATYDHIASIFPAPPPATDRNEETSKHNYGSR